MRINQPAVDYLRVGSWASEMSYYWLALVQQIARVENVSAESKRFLQYRGTGCSWAFAGVAQQGKERREHTLIQISGERAHTYRQQVRALAEKGGGKATRVDLQVTVPMVGTWEPEEWAETLVRGEWGHRPPGVRVILGDDGLHTLYIGSRGSTRYIRFYVKEDDRGDRYLRFEVEYKGDRAQFVWERCHDEQKIRAILGGELEKLPLWRQGAQYRAIEVALVPGGAVPALNRTSGGKTIAWMHETVDPVVRRLLASHEYGGTMRELLFAWLVAAEENDRQA